MTHNDINTTIPFTYKFEYANNEIKNGYITISYDTTLPITKTRNAKIIKYINKNYAAIDITTDFPTIYSSDKPQILFLEVSQNYKKYKLGTFSGTTSEYIVLKINGIKRIINFSLGFTYDWSNGVVADDIRDLTYDFKVDADINHKIKLLVIEHFISKIYLPNESTVKRIKSSYDNKQHVNKKIVDVYDEDSGE